MPSGATYTCPFCPFSCTQLYIVGHIVDKHPAELYNSPSVKFDIGRGAQGKAAAVIVMNGKERQRSLCCYGCNKFWAREGLAHKHYTDCANKEKHKEVCQTLMKTGTLSTPAPSPGDSPTAPPAPADNAEVDKLKAQLTKLQRSLENTRLGNKRDAQMLDTLMTALKEVGDEPFFKILSDKCQLIDAVRDEENTSDEDIVEIDWDMEFFG